MKRQFIVLLAAGLLPRLWIALLPVMDSFRLGVPDDAYYYFTIARNLALGYGATSDRLAPTNGFHPLWLSAIVPFWFLAPAAEFPVHLALLTSAFLNTCAALPLFILSRRLGLTGGLAFGAAAIYLFNPFGVAMGADGLETSLALFLFGLSLLFGWKLTDRLALPASVWATTGLIWGLLLIARTDYVFIVVGLGLQLVWHWRFELGKMRSRFLALVLAGSAPLVPWVAWNIYTFGTISQVSSEAYPFYQHTIWFAKHGIDWVALLQRETQLFVNAILNLSRWLAFGRWFAIVALALFVAVWQREPVRRSKIFSRLALPTLLVLITLLYHALYRWMYQPWYIAPLALLVPLWIGLALDALWAQKKKWVLMGALGLLIAFYANAGWDLARAGGMYPGQIENLSRDFCGGYERIGESDSGFSMYFAPCTVVNLDGVVNNAAFEAIKGKRLHDYLDRARIEHIALNPTVAEIVRLQEGELGETPPWH